MKRSKYATLDRVIVHALRDRPQHGMSQCTLLNWGGVRSFAARFKGGPSAVISARLQRLKARDEVWNNGVSGDGCRWYAAP